MKRGPKPSEIIADGNKLCKRCATWKPFEEFQKLKKSSDGMQRYCKVCQNKMTSSYRDKTDRSWWKSKGIYSVYSLVNPNGEVYIGSTEVDPYLRYSRHKANYKFGSTETQIPKLFTSFDEFGMDAHIFKVVEEFNTKKEVRIAEDKYIKMFQEQGISLNIQGAVNKRKSYYVPKNK